MKTTAHLLCFSALSIMGSFFALSGCKQEEEVFLKPKVYFEETNIDIPISDKKIVIQDLQVRLSSFSQEEADLKISLGGQELVDQYNQKNGTEYLLMASDNATLDKNSVRVPEGTIYSDKIRVQLSGLDKMEDGKSYLLPIKIQHSTLPIIRNTSVAYLRLTKPIRILKAWDLRNDFIRIPLPLGQTFKSLTYEALIRFNSFNSNNTIMGREGILILRIGDSALPGGANNLLQIAGSKQFHSEEVKFVTNQWYHVAFSYDDGSGKATLYVNGKKIAESGWAGSTFDIAPEMYIGKVAGFMWGERPFVGQMSEVRLWNVPRTESQLEKNMLSVAPDSEGLVAYYHLNGEDLTQDEKGQFVITDASGHGMDGLMNGGDGMYRIASLEEPIEIK